MPGSGGVNTRGASGGGAGGSGEMEGRQTDFSKIPLPTFNWDAEDKCEAIQIFRLALSKWLKMKRVEDEEAQLDMALMILGSEGFKVFEHWTPDDVADKKDYNKFLDYMLRGVDNNVTHRLLTYELEDTRKKPDESVDDLMDRMRQMAHQCHVFDGSDTAIEYEPQRCLIRAIPNKDITL